MSVSVVHNGLWCTRHDCIRQRRFDGAIFRSAHALNRPTHALHRLSHSLTHSIDRSLACSRFHPVWSRVVVIVCHQTGRFVVAHPPPPYAARVQQPQNVATRMASAASMDEHESMHTGAGTYVTLPITSTHTLERIRTLLMRPTDVLICSWPKSGTVRTCVSILRR